MNCQVVGLLMGKEPVTHITGTNNACKICDSQLVMQAALYRISDVVDK